MRLLCFILAAASGLGVGLVSSIAGIGGGSLMVPLMILVLGVDAKIAVASSLLTIVVTSAFSSSIYLREKLVNLKAALSLEPTATLGAILGANITVSLPSSAVKRILGFGLIAVSIMVLLKPLLRAEEAEGTGALRNLHLGAAASFPAGVASGMLGIGGGVLKVPVMNLIMSIPIREAVATSSFMAGLTASSGGIVYLAKGLVDPVLVLGLAIGVAPGATIGAKTLKKLKPAYIRTVFSLVLMYAALRLTGWLS